MSGDSVHPGEFGLIRAWTKNLATGENVVHGIGDDCAVVRSGGKEFLLTCDASLEGVHFHRDWGAPEDIGWKAAVSALSDIAAMGGRANFVLVTLALPRDLAVAYSEALYRGMADAVAAAGAVIVGGDTTASQSGIVIDVTVVGEVVGRAMLRRGARPGDVIAVTGVPGRRGAGLHALLHGIEAPALIREYLHPTPRLLEGQWLQGQAEVRAMMDVSDGILPDAGHIARASGVGIDLWPGRLVADEAVDAFWAGLGRVAGVERLRSGEGYELMVVIGAEEADGVCGEFEAAFGLGLGVVGVCVAGDGEGGVTVDGVASGVCGFEHFR